MTAEEDDGLAGKEVSAAEIRRKLERLKGSRGVPPRPDEAPPPGGNPLDLAKLRGPVEALKVGRGHALDPLCQSLLEVARAALAKGDVTQAAEALEGLLDVVPAGHAQRGELEAFERTVRGLAAAKEPRGDRAPTPSEVVDPALSAGYLLMAAQDGELTPEEAASLEERLGPADAALRVEWGWLERARAALGRVATFEPSEGDPAWDRLRARVRDGLDRPASAEAPLAIDRTELERMRSEMENQAAEMRALVSGLAGALATALPVESSPDIAKQLRATQSSLADQLRRSIGTLGGSPQEFDFTPEAAAALFASGPPAQPPVVRAASGSSEPPARPPRPRRIERVAGSLEVATLHLAGAEPYGDLVDVSDHPGGVDVVLLDPSGRGPDATATAMATQVGLQAALAAGAAPIGAVVAVNRVLPRAIDRGSFVAGTLVRWDEARGVAVLAGFGGEDAVVRRARRGSGVEVERVKPGGVVLGAVREAPPFPTREVELAPGDLLLLVSDGVTEQPGPDGTPYCDERWTRLLALLTKFGHLEAAAFVKTLEAELRAWGSFSEGGPRDDVVIVALRRR